MARRFDRYIRIEPRTPFGDLNRGLRAEIHDPMWFLGRQWQVGEHQGENASSPVRIDMEVRETVLKVLDERPSADLQKTPPEALVEQEPDDWWTPGRRVAIGRRAAPSLPPINAADLTLLLADLPTPYQRLNGLGYDGLKVHAAQASLGLDPALFQDVPVLPQRDLWNATELAYDANFLLEGGAPELRLSGHRGGHLDWYSVDASAPLPPAPVDQLRSFDAIPTRLSFPGAPHPRWWQIEHHAVDIGAMAPDRSHFATLLLIEAVSSQGDNWFQLPIVTQAGYVLSLQTAVVTDSFGDEWKLSVPTSWSLYRVDGFGPNSTVIWPTVALPLRGQLLEDVLLGIDEDANLLVAVEQRLAGRDVPTPAGKGLLVEGDASAAEATVNANTQASYRYFASEGLHAGWHPYVIDDATGARRFVQARFANLETAAADLLPEATARLLQDPAATATDPVHAIEPGAVPELGLRLQRRPVLGRATDGRPLLWVERRKRPLLAPPTFDLAFDVPALRVVADVG